ncbi:hypothetical protein EVAR_93206_1 [Eumeta japonica]|uniref:Uncharacterized protein n=1 Tax=Eumeta variegata TaxID=151549 RepID=A0A4C1TXY4_EUMVA|nr:hypothetical protein EVAR_93206_1 [Eumeta japonica]
MRDARRTIKSNKELSRRDGGGRWRGGCDADGGRAGAGRPPPPAPAPRPAPQLDLDYYPDDARDDPEDVGRNGVRRHRAHLYSGEWLRTCYAGLRPATATATPVFTLLMFIKRTRRGPEERMRSSALSTLITDVYQRLLPLVSLVCMETIHVYSLHIHAQLILRIP